MPRPILHSLTFLLILGLLIPAAGCRLEQAAVCQGCNVVLVSMDTLRADHTGAYGYGLPTTPQLDLFAQEAVLFEDAVSQSAWTRPAHTSMFTGLYPAEHGVISMGGNAKVPGDLPTLAERMREGGYATAAFTGGANMSARFGFDRGFDLYKSPGKLMGEGVKPALDWVDSLPAGKPFFLFVHGFEPHRPYRSEAQDRLALGLASSRRKGWASVCESGERPADLDRWILEYDAAIHGGDRAFGRLLAGLSERGLGDDTIVMFTSDHGEEFFEHGHCFHLYRLYREILRVPLLVRVPGVEPSRVAGVVPASVAVASTLLDLVGLGGAGFSGESLARLITGVEKPAFEYVVSETGSSRVSGSSGRKGGDVRAISGDRDKLVHWMEQRRREYYDLSSDPGEQDDLGRSAEADRLFERLQRWTGDHPRRGTQAAIEELDPQLKQELRQLGYLE
ncbi:MAG: sulfatase [Deltaproteobacteria bacterium]|nr:sulfatase [Deltaproteobacteria bacterium]